MKLFRFIMVLICFVFVIFTMMSCALKPILIEFAGVFRIPGFATSVSIAPFVTDLEGEIKSKLKDFSIISEPGNPLRLHYATSLVNLGYDDLNLDTDLSTELMDATSMNFNFSFTPPEIPGFADVDIDLPDTSFNSYTENVNMDSVDVGNFVIANIRAGLPGGNPVVQPHNLPLEVNKNFSNNFEGQVLSGTFEASVTLSDDSTLTIMVFNSHNNLVARIIQKFNAGNSTIASTPLNDAILTKGATVSILSSDAVGDALIDLSIKNLKLKKATDVWFDSHTGEGSLVIDTGLEAYNFDGLTLNGNIDLGISLNAFENVTFDATVTLYEKGSRALPKTLNLTQNQTSAQMNFTDDTIKATDLILEYEYRVNSGGEGSYANIDLSGTDDILFSATPSVYPVSVTNFKPGMSVDADLPASVVAAVINTGSIEVDFSNGVTLDNITGKLEMKDSNNINLDNSLSLAGNTIYGGEATFTIDSISISGMTQGLNKITVSSSITNLTISSATISMNESDGVNYSDSLKVDIPENIKGLLKRIILNNSPNIHIEWNNNTPVDINLKLLSDEIGIDEMVNMQGIGAPLVSSRAVGNTTISIPTTLDLEGKDTVTISIDASPTGYKPDTLYIDNEIELGREYTFDSTVNVSDIKFDKIVIATDTSFNVLELPVSELPSWFVDNSPHITMKPGSIYASLLAQADFAENPDFNATVLIEDGTGPAANVEYSLPVFLNENVYFSGAIEEFMNKPEKFRNVKLELDVKEATVSLNETMNASATVDISVEFKSATDITVITGVENINLNQAKDAITYIGGATLVVNLNNGAGVAAKLKLTESTEEGTPIHLVDDSGIIQIPVGVSKLSIPLSKELINRIADTGIDFFYKIILAKTPDNQYYSVIGGSSVSADVNVEINLKYVGKINLSEKK